MKKAKPKTGLAHSRTGEEGMIYTFGDKRALPFNEVNCKGGPTHTHTHTQILVIGGRRPASQEHSYSSKVGGLTDRLQSE